MTTWDPEKRAENLRSHKVDLTDAEAFVWETALIEEDLTETYNEQRFRAIGEINGKLYVYVYKYNADGSDRAISLREAEKKEKRYYVRKLYEL